jgi:hypothetical protein
MNISKISAGVKASLAYWGEWLELMSYGAFRYPEHKCFQCECSLNAEEIKYYENSCEECELENLGRYREGDL